jgi:short-subunit dehydrogenase involved in D-alanine esterification of teichoic acids
MIRWSAEDPLHGVVRGNNIRSPLMLVELFENHPADWVWGIWTMSSGLDAIATGDAPSYATAKSTVEKRVRALLLEALGRRDPKARR